MFAYQNSEVIYMALCMIIPIAFIVLGFIFNKGNKEEK